MSFEGKVTAILEKPFCLMLQKLFIMLRKSLYFINFQQKQRSLLHIRILLHHNEKSISQKVRNFVAEKGKYD